MTDNSRNRERFSMDKDWRFHLGDIEIPLGKGHGEVYGFAKAGGAKGPAETDWNDTEWQWVNLPHDWANGLDFDSSERANLGYKPRGIGWYRKSFLLEEADKGKQLLLEFDGIATNATIYFNGSIQERNWSGYNSFCVDISDRAFYGNKPNTLAIRVDAGLWEGWWYEGAGIYRHTWLAKKSPVNIAHWGIWVNPKRLDNHTWETQIETTLQNTLYADESFTLVSKILDPNGNSLGRAEANGLCSSGEQSAVKQSITVENPSLWDIDTPYLYKLVSELYQNGVLVDRDVTQYGYRTIRISAEKGFYLNDRPVKIKGTCNHQDHAGLGVALPDSMHEYRIQRLKEMGCNAYRCAHNNPAKELLDACDKLGMLVMDENRNFETSGEVIRQVESMVKRDRNHPSIIMYSIYNEEPHQGTPQGRAMAKRLMHTIKRLDDTRPVLGAMNGGVMEDEGTADILDITGINYQLDIYDAFHKKHPDQPMLGSENTSSFSTRGIYESDTEKQVFNCYDEEKAPWGATIRDTWKAINSRDFVMGMFSWTGFDYLGEPSPYTWPSVSTFFGSMDTCGFAKDGFYMHKACWTDEPMVHILPHWNWKGREGTPIRVMSHTNCDEVELFLNGISQGRKPSRVYEQATWQVCYEPGTLWMKGYRNGIEVAEAKMETTGEAAALRLEPVRDYIFGDGVDAVPVNVSAVDSQGRFVPTSNQKVKFSVIGLGKLIGVGNGDPNCHEPFLAIERSLFNGRCQGILQSEAGTGTVTVRVDADGLQPAELTMQVKYKEVPCYLGTVNNRYLTNWRMTHELFSEKPDPNVEIGDSDMNTWEPLEVGDGPQRKFDNHLNYYGLYRTVFDLSARDAEKTMTLYFTEVKGYVEVYVNKEKLAEKDCMEGSSLEVPLRPGQSGKLTLTVLIQCNNANQPGAGICKSVILRN